MVERTIINFRGNNPPKAINRLKSFWRSLVNHMRWGRKFMSLGWGSRIEGFVLLNNPDQISIGRRTGIRSYARMETYGPKSNTPKISIGENAQIQNFFHCSALMSVKIGNNVLIGSRVTIIDSDHLFDDPVRPAVKCPECVCAPVVIEDGAWLAEGCVILKGVTVGERAVVAANAVVTKDVPPYTIVGGIPAKIIGKIDINKRANDETSK